jgi:hypothetical protein
MNHTFERPIETERDDRLLRQVLVARLLTALIEPGGRAPGAVLGLASPSGAGKSSGLNMVAELAERHHPSAVVIRFNPCLASPRNGLVHAFFVEAMAALEASAKSQNCQQPDKLKSFGQTLFRYAKRIAPADNILLCDGGAAAAGLDALRQSPPAGDTLHHMRAELCRELDESGIDVVVLIDEIDRLGQREIAVVAQQLVRVVASFERFSYLLAYDADRTANALGNSDGEPGGASLERLVQQQVALPCALPRQIRRLVSQRFSELVDEPDEQRQRLSQLFSVLVPGVLGTVRDAAYCEVLLDGRGEVLQRDNAGLHHTGHEVPVCKETAGGFALQMEQAGQRQHSWQVHPQRQGRAFRGARLHGHIQSRGSDALDGNRSVQFRIHRSASVAGRKCADPDASAASGCSARSATCASTTRVSEAAAPTGAAPRQTLRASADSSAAWSAASIADA